MIHQNFWLFHKSAINHPMSQSIDKPRAIDALLGTGIYDDLICISKIEKPNQKVRFFKKKFRWIITGKVGNPNISAKSNSYMLALNSLHKRITKIWEIENRTILSEEDFQVEEHFKQTTLRALATKRYIVRLPFKEKS